MIRARTLKYIHNKISLDIIDIGLLYKCGFLHKKHLCQSNQPTQCFTIFQFISFTENVPEVLPFMAHTHIEQSLSVPTQNIIVKNSSSEEVQVFNLFIYAFLVT